MEVAEELGVGHNNQLIIIDPEVDDSTIVPPPLPVHDEEEAKKAARAKQMRVGDFETGNCSFLV